MLQNAKHLQPVVTQFILLHNCVLFSIFFYNYIKELKEEKTDTQVKERMCMVFPFQENEHRQKSANKVEKSQEN